RPHRSAATSGAASPLPRGGDGCRAAGGEPRRGTRPSRADGAWRAGSRNKGRPVTVPGVPRFLSRLRRPGVWVVAAMLLVALALLATWLRAWYSWRAGPSAMAHIRKQESQPRLVR